MSEEEGASEKGEISAKSLPFKCPHSIHSAPLLAGRKAGRQAYYLQGCSTKTTLGCARAGCSSARPCNVDLFLPVAQVLRPSRLREHGERERERDGYEIDITSSWMEEYKTALCRDLREKEQRERS